MLETLLLACLPAAAPTDVALPFLSVTDTAYGTTAPVLAPTPTSYLGLVPGHAVRFQVQGLPADAGDPAILFASTALLSVPLAIGSELLLVDPAHGFLVAQSAVGAAGTAEWPLVVPVTLPAGIELFTQAAVLHAASGGLDLTNALQHAVTDVAPKLLLQLTHSSHPLAFAPTGGTKLVGSAAEWQAEWASIGFGGSPPAVDFAREVVVMHFAGIFMTSGYSVTIASIDPLGPGALASAVLTVPHPTCGVFFVQTSPACLVAVDRVAAGVPFQALQTPVETAPCP